jgi:hypothetical protein
MATKLVPVRPPVWAALVIIASVVASFYITVTTIPELRPPPLMCTRTIRLPSNLDVDQSSPLLLFRPDPLSSVASLHLFD